ncbi:hypothetical protein HPP92_001392 [Vanilla planifolia]|uniref:Uncharacterized protein n=1 Tax=Vanilla planifolia TaxID=51239 RepID=A0A835RQZ8_VANPL|nr:hypothetical protein HPP92_001392 [Vanilla planifolia]
MVLFLGWALAQPNLPKEVNTYNVVLKALGREFFVFMAQVSLFMKKNWTKRKINKRAYAKLCHSSLPLDSRHA